MAIKNYYLTKNPYFNDGKWITGSNLKGFMLHSVGCSQPDPIVFIRNWNSPNFTYAGINGFIGADITYITAPCLETPGRVKRMPHAGKSIGNNNYIGFEMCEPGSITYTTGANFKINNKSDAIAFTKKVYNNAVELFAELCKFHGKNPLTPGVIISHNEGGKSGVASGHVDPEHLWKGLGLPYTMDRFRQDVYNRMNKITVEEEEDDMTDERFAELMANYRKKLQDNDAGSWSEADRNWCINKGLIQGSGNDNYMWADFLTREQMAALLHRFAKMIGEE